MRKSTRTKAGFAVALLLGLTGAGIIAGQAAAKETKPASHNDTARFLAGLAPAAGSPIAALANSKSWRSHAKGLDSSWNSIETRQLSKIRKWSEQVLPGGQKTMLYLFSGPDFLYGNTFFPNAETYVLAGLEPIGEEPDLVNLSQGRVAAGLIQLRQSVSSVLRLSFFITKKMKVQLREGRFKGILPVLMTFIARADKSIDEIIYVKLNDDGSLTTLASDDSASGVRITFTGTGKVKKQTLYYFRTDLSNGGVKKSGFLAFCRGLGPADSFLKSASYLMHSGGFSTVRSFLLEQSQRLVEDDSGIPLKYFDKAVWDVKPYGNYTGPIKLFAGRYQSDMRRLYRDGKAQPINFGIGYRWRPKESSVLVAVKRKQ